MASESKSFPSTLYSSESKLRERTQTRNLLEIAMVFGLILVAGWTPQGHLNSAISLSAALLTIALTFVGGYSSTELGLDRPFSGATQTLALGTLLVAVIAVVGLLTRSIGPSQALPLNRAWQYAIWALVQEFILQSFIYVRLEKVVGPRKAILYASLLFALAHVPSPLLTSLSFLGALFFCEMFRRYRNIYPLGVVHAALGLAIASSLPDHLLHHMRVGIGFLMYHG
ncbi:MAG TPA: CPBP family intramembrane glutamic endopeptidase [Terriglobales bacterium]|nr:CPBP family intramembrane glutamic endopeptidase [Terriglobales bacterium]